MRFGHPVEVNETLFAATEDGLAVGVVIGIGRRVDDVRRFGLGLDELRVSLLGDIADSILVLLGQVFAQVELELGVVALLDQRLFGLMGNKNNKND